MEESFFFGAKSSFTGECTTIYWASALNENEYPNKHRCLQHSGDDCRNKTAGIDGIPAEFYKVNPNQAVCLLQPLILEAWDNEIFPNKWTDDIIVKIPKTGN